MAAPSWPPYFEASQNLLVTNRILLGGFANYYQSLTHQNLSLEEAKERAKNTEVKGKLPQADQVLNYLAWSNSVEVLKKVGRKTKYHLKKLKIEKVEDLLFHFPHRYLDLRRVVKINEVKVGGEVTVVGEVKEVTRRLTKKRFKLIQVAIFDGTGYLKGVWFNQDYIATIFKEGMRVAFGGRVTFRYGQLQIENPLFDILGEEKEGFHTGRLLPIYPATSSLSPHRLRKLLSEARPFMKVPEIFPAWLRQRFGFVSRTQAFLGIHFPQSVEEVAEAKRRLLFEELFLIQLGLAMRKKRMEIKEKGYAHQVKGQLLNDFIQGLPFELTTDQKRALEEIKRDMSAKKPMNRLVQGEVGSGKTVLAAAAMVIAAQAGFQAAMMAPTEILAVQHLRRISQFLKHLPLKVALLIGSTSAKEREKLLPAIASGEINVVVGTHALIQEKVKFKRMSLVVIDEQHRFGVWQRFRLKEKGTFPDMLVMTATPIPRTLSLTLYGDLDISIIRELPQGRKIAENVKTVLCQTQKRRNWAYEKVREEVEKGHQAYIICPLIEESDKLEAKAVLEEAERLKNQVFLDLRVGILFGKMKPQEKDEVMMSFAQGELDVLISTTVIEVGIDVPNATVMLIENADRFGLTQLHQLRGRIGRGGYPSYCILFGKPKTEEGKKRLKAMEKITDGFRLAEEDLMIRGEGEIFGARQAGFPDLKIARLTRDVEVLVEARKVAFELIEKDLELTQPVNALLKWEVKRRFSDKLDWLFRA